MQLHHTHLRELQLIFFTIELPIIGLFWFSHELDICKLDLGTIGLWSFYSWSRWQLVFLHMNHDDLFTNDLWTVYLLDYWTFNFYISDLLTIDLLVSWSFVLCMNWTYWHLILAQLVFFTFDLSTVVLVDLWVHQTRNLHFSKSTRVPLDPLNFDFRTPYWNFNNLQNSQFSM